MKAEPFMMDIPAILTIYFGDIDYPLGYLSLNTIMLGILFHPKPFLYTFKGRSPVVFVAN